MAKTPESERQIALCEDALGHYSVAADWYEKFLAHVPPKTPSAGDDARKRLGEIKTMPGKVRVESTPAGAAVVVDERQAATPTPVALELSPGPHKLKLSIDGREPVERAVDVLFASSQTVAIDLPPLSAAPPAPPVVAEIVPPTLPVSQPTSSPPRSLVPAFVTGGLAVASAIVGVVFGALALNDKSSFDKNPSTSKADDGDSHSLVADMAFGVGITFGVTSAVLFLTKDDQPTAASIVPAGGPRTTASRVTVTPTPLVDAHGCGAGLRVSF